MIVVTNNKRLDKNYSINFIDENDLYIGFDDNQCCCEYVDYFVSDLSDTSCEFADQMPDHDLAGWNFVDPRILPETFVDLEDPYADEGGHIAFMIVHPEFGSKWLHFFNIHNGYYGHTVLMRDAQDNAVLKKESI
jgi:hypothetical protein